MKAIGIDIGTTSICGILVECESGRILRSVTKNSEAFIKTSNDWEKIQDTDKIINMAVGIVDSLIEDDITVIGVTGQMHGIVYLDGMGKAVSPLYTWQDARGSLKYDEEKTYSELLNIPVGYGAVTDFYNAHNGIRPQNAVRYCTIHDYLAMTLSGKTEPLIHTSDAASFGGFDLETNTFKHEFNSKITADFAIMGEYKGIPVSVAIGDNQASVFGALDSDDAILLNVGTGSQISVISSEIIKGENIEVRPYFDNKFLIVGSALCGGRAYSLLEKFYSDIVFAATGERINMYGIMDKMLIGEGSHMTADTRFDGTRADPSIKGSISNITVENLNPAEMRYAFLNGIIAELYGLFSEMKVERGKLVGSGNGIRKNAALIKAAEDAFGISMKLPVHLEEAAFGAALFGMVAASGHDAISGVREIIRYQ